jgi:hypothetical protein
MGGCVWGKDTLGCWIAAREDNDGHLAALLESVLALTKSAAIQHRNRIERSKGRQWAHYTN